MRPIKPHTFKETILTIENLFLRLGNNLILRDINTEIKNVVRPDVIQGQVVAILGRSGIGKTQFFRTIAGLQKPSAGQILIGQEKKPVKVGQAGVVFQNYYISPRLTVINALIRAGKQGGLSTKEAKEKGISFLEKFGIAERRNFYPAQLSGGQRQRVAIIEQLMCSEKLLLMDEPFSGLDYKAKEDACGLINTVASQNEENTIIVVTHDIDSALAIADTVWLMGQDKDEKGNKIPGARIVEKIDLIVDYPLAWRPGIQFTAEFNELVRAIQTKFVDPKGPYA